MSPIVLIVAATVQPMLPDRGEILPDAMRFGVCRGIVAANLQTIELHNRMIRDYPQWCQSAWEFRQTEVKNAWRSLGRALDSSRPMYERVREMELLRHDIGDAAFHAGAMPCPIPAYGKWCPALAK